MGDALWLVVDAPYVQLKVWPLQVHDGEAGKYATLDARGWHMKAWVSHDDIEHDRCYFHKIDSVFVQNSSLN